MQIQFKGNLDNLKKGVELLSRDLNYEIGKGGLEIELSKRPGDLKIKVENNKASIGYEKRIHFFRALGLLLEKIETKKEFEITEKPQFEMNGFMADMSRNSVMKVDSIKKMLRLMAVMGLNMMMLYTEDTYEIEDLPYFGYMRGRYSQDELEECDDYANHFGIEMVPCIQTLAHMKEALKWKYAGELKDTADILLAGEEKTYQFIEKMIKTASSPFRSDRIHIGMDEAHQLGRGKYLDKNGYQSRFQIMNNHLRRVKEIALNNGLEPMIWSDMYFRLGSETGEYYDLEAEIPEEVIEDMPEDVDLVYWDYYHNKQDFYLNFIKEHKKFGKDPIFAGGIWTWTGVTPNLNKSIVTTNAALSACKKEDIKEVFATMWGDNGAETSVFSALIGLQLYAEHGYNKEIDMDRIKERFEFCTGGDYDSFMDLAKLDAIPEIGEENITVQSNPSKYLLWQDPLLGLFDKHVEGLDLANYYSDLKKKIKDNIEINPEWDFIFDFYYKLTKVLAIKSDLGLRIKKKYDSNDRKGLKIIVNKEIPQLILDIDKLRLAHRKQWLKSSKAFGWEVIDLRYGGLLARMRTSVDRLNDYLNNEIDQIDELEEERLYYDGSQRPEGVKLGKFKRYHKIVSASPLI